MTHHIIVLICVCMHVKPYFLLSSNVWVFGCVFLDGAAHRKILINYDPFLCRLKDRWLVYILHSDGDGCSGGGGGQRNSIRNLVRCHYQQREIVGLLKVQSLKRFGQLDFYFLRKKIIPITDLIKYSKSLGLVIFIKFFLLYLFKTLNALI